MGVFWGWVIFVCFFFLFCTLCGLLLCGAHCKEKNGTRGFQATEKMDHRFLFFTTLLFPFPPSDDMIANPNPIPIAGSVTPGRTLTSARRQPQPYPRLLARPGESFGPSTPTLSLAHPSSKKLGSLTLTLSSSLSCRWDGWRRHRPPAGRGFRAGQQTQIRVAKTKTATPQSTSHPPPLLPRPPTPSTAPSPPRCAPRWPAARAACRWL